MYVSNITTCINFCELTVFYILPQHDTTIACMSSALGVFNGLRPPYATAFFVEFYSNEDG